ncbi:hypothetical protein PG984_011733 [Apiospora sp. TS-2023a]
MTHGATQRGCPHFPSRLLRRHQIPVLEWSLLRPVSEIQVMTIEDDAPVWAASLFGTDRQADNPLASQSAADPPHHHLVVTLDSVETWEYWQDAEAMEDRPLPLVIDNEHGEMITIGQFVTGIHAYAISIKTVVYDCLKVPAVPPVERMSCFTTTAA